jgi:hypothetical protein
MDIDISKLSKKARRRLDMYICRSSKYNLIFSFCLLLLVFLPALGAELGSFIGGENSYGESCGAATGTILMVVFFIIFIKKANNLVAQFIQKLGEMKKYPICFECKQDLKGCEQDNCPNCGADIRIHFISDEAASKIPVKLSFFNKIKIKDSVCWIICLALFYLTIFIIMIMMFQCSILKFMGNYGDEFLARMNAVSNFESGKIRFFEVKPNEGHREDQKADKTENGIPVWYKYYDISQPPFLWGYSFIPTEKEYIFRFVEAYNDRMRQLLDLKSRTVILSEKNCFSYRLCSDDCFHIKLDSKFIYNDYVSFAGKETGKGFIKDIIISDDGNIFYNIQTEKSGVVENRIKQDEIKLIKRQNKDDQIP